MTQIWVHSDWHWQHENIYKFTSWDGGPRVRERFSGWREGDDYMEQRWRELVKPEDHVYCLGDMTMHRKNHHKTDFIKFFKSLPGYKRLILGNHDHYDVGVYKEAGFQKVKGSHLHDGVLMTHYPVHKSSIGRAIGNAHGHIHEKPSPADAPYFNCCVEVNNYEPIPIEVIQFKLREWKPKFSTDINGIPILGE